MSATGFDMPMETTVKTEATAMLINCMICNQSLQGIDFNDFILVLPGLLTLMYLLASLSAR